MTDRRDSGRPRLPPETLHALWQLIMREARPARDDKYAKNLETKAIDWRFMSYSDIEDLLFAYGLRWPVHDVPLDLLGAYFEIEPGWSYFRPTRKGAGAVGFQALRLDDAVLFLILIERLGFPINAERLVSAVRAPIASARKLSRAELEAYSYLQQRGKWPPLVLYSDIDSIDRGRSRELHRTISGYRAEALLDGSGSVVRIEIRAPRYRSPRPTVEIVCPQCATQYTRGDPDSGAEHRREHKARMRILDPSPSKRLLAERTAQDEPTLVQTHSPAWKHREIYERARAFKRKRPPLSP
jgi:hypothetical protein